MTHDFFRPHKIHVCGALVIASTMYHGFLDHNLFVDVGPLSIGYDVGDGLNAKGSKYDDYISIQRQRWENTRYKTMIFDFVKQDTIADVGPQLWNDRVDKNNLHNYLSRHLFKKRMTCILWDL